MKLVACCVPLIIVFCVLHSVHAELIRENVIDVNDKWGGSAGLSGDGTGVDASAAADGQDPICWAYRGGYKSVTPTVAGYYQVTYHLGASVHASVYLCTGFQQCCAQGGAEVGVHGPGIADNSLVPSKTVSSDQFQGIYVISDEGEPNDIDYASGVVYCSAYQSVATTNDTSAATVVCDYASDLAFADAHSEDNCDLIPQ